MDNQKCKLCTEPFPAFVLSFANRVAVEAGYCSHFCLRSDLGLEGATKVLQEYREKKLHNSSISEEAQNGG